MRWNKGRRHGRGRRVETWEGMEEGDMGEDGGRRHGREWRKEAERTGRTGKSESDVIIF